MLLVACDDGSESDPETMVDGGIMPDGAVVDPDAADPPDPDDGVPPPDAAPDPDDGVPPPDAGPDPDVGPDPDAAPDPDDGVPPPDPDAAVEPPEVPECELNEDLIEPVWVAGEAGPPEALGAFGKPDAFFIDPRGYLIAGDEDAAYEEVHVYALGDGPVLEPLVDWSANPGPGGAGPFEFRGISGFARDADTGRLYVAEQGNDRVQLLRPIDDAPFYEHEGFLGRAAPDPDNPADGTFVRLQALATDALGRLFVTDDARGSPAGVRRDVQIFDRDGAYLDRFGDDREGDVGVGGNLSEPENITLDEASDRIYVCDEATRNVAIYRYTDREFIQRLGGFVGEPNGIDVDRYGYVYAVDQGGRDVGAFVRVFEPGRLTQVFRFGGWSETADMTLGLFNSPDTLVVDEERDLLVVADQGHKRIQGFRLSEVQARACLRTLRVSGPSKAVRGSTVTLRVEVLLPGGGLDRWRFRREASVGGVPFTIHNGQGTVTVPAAELLTVRAGALTATHAVEFVEPVAAEGLVWDGAVRVAGVVNVPAGETLRIEAGTLVVLDADARIEADGNIVVAGTEAEPVGFVASDPEAGWGQIDHRGGRALYRNAFFSNGAHAFWERNDEFRHCCAYHLRAREGRIELNRTVIADSPGKGLLTFDAEVVVRGAIFQRLGHGAELVHGTAVIEDSLFAGFRGADDNDGIYLSEKDAPGEFNLRGVIIADADDDGLDTENASPVAVDLVVYDIVDKALALTGGSPVFRNCLATGARLGIKHDDKFRTARNEPLFENCTIAGNSETGFRGSERAGLDAEAEIYPTFLRSVIASNGGESIIHDWPLDQVTLDDSLVDAAPDGVVVREPLAGVATFLSKARRDWRLHPLAPGAGRVGWQGFEAFEPPPPAPVGPVKLNELAAAGDPLDWVELYNPSDEDVDVGGLRISDDPMLRDRAVLPANTVVPARGFLVIELDPAGFPGFGLGPAESVLLTSPGGGVVDEVSWVDGASPEGATYGRIPDGDGEWKTLFTPSPGEANVDNDGPPRCGDGNLNPGEQCDDGDLEDGDGCDSNCQFEVRAGSIVINEVSASGEDWFELTNIGEREVSLSRWLMTDEDTGAHRFLFPAGIALAPGGYMVFERGPDGFDFGLGAADAVVLFDSRGQRVDVADWDDGDAPMGATFARIPDGVGEFQTTMRPTRGAQNRE